MRKQFVIFHDGSKKSRSTLRGRLFALWVLLAATPLFAQGPMPPQFEGRWWYGFISEASLPVNLTFAADSKGELAPVLYSPMQTKEPLPATTWSFHNDTLRYSHKASGVRLTLRWQQSDSTFSGTMRQGLMRSTLRFTPSEGLFSPNRPQTPQPPYPFREEELVIQRKKADVTLAGTLTLPEGDGPFPAVILISGSGQQDRDETILEHRPFRVIADYLTRRGIAVFRYDDRGVGGSKGEVNQATTLDFADDAEAVYNYLRKDKRLDKNHMGLLGHSEGALIATIVASRNKRVDFVVTLGGQAGSGAQILLEQNERIMQLNGVPQALNDLHTQLLDTFFHAIRQLQPSQYQDFLVSEAARLSEGLTDEQRKQASLRKADAITFASQMQLPWLQTFVVLDNGDYLRRLRCPLLAINGEKDCQVVASNLDGIKRRAGGRVETHLMPGLNHLMQPCQTGGPDEYLTIEQTIAPEVLLLVAHWINQETHPQSKEY